jgi:RNA polymerase II subunit A-like phosphatase
MSDTPTPLTLPSTLPYPLTITKIHVSPSQSIVRGTPIFEYTFTSTTTRLLLSSKSATSKEKEGLRKNDMVGIWESGLQGEVRKLEGWFKVGEVMERKHAGLVCSYDYDRADSCFIIRRTIIHVQQPCSHPVQLHGMCGVCGADLTAYISSNIAHE